MTDGQPPTPERLADIAAIQDLAIAYGFAVDDRDFVRWEALFTPDANIDYTQSGGIKGIPSEVGAWMPDAMSTFTWGLHSISNHEIRFTSEDGASGRVHLFNRNGVEWEGQPEFVDVGGMYLDQYAKVDGAWRFSERIEETFYIAGGNFAALIRDMAASTAAGGKRPFG